MKKFLLILILFSVISLSAQTKPKAAYKGLFSGVDIDTNLALGVGAVVAVAAAILIYNSDNSH